MRPPAVAPHRAATRRDMRAERPKPERTIDSLQNPLVKRTRALELDRGLRDREGLYLAWGLHLALEATASGVSLERGMVGPALERSAEGREVLQRLRQRDAPILRVSTRVLESIVPGAGDQGILLVARRRAARLESMLEGRPTLILLAHGVQDPGNLGSILRTARAFGCEAVAALEGCADPYGSRAVRAAMGAQFTLPVVCATAGAALAASREAGLQVIASDPRASDPPTGLDLRTPSALMLGNEGAGLPAEVLRQAARRVRIPMRPGVESLNVHAAATALLYETARQRGFERLR